VADVSIAAATAAGVVSFLSPCVLPLVPGYIAFVSGGGDSAEPAGGGAGGRTRLVVTRAAGFVLGFSTIFVALGASATRVGRFLTAHALAFEKIAGLVVILFGLHMIGLLRIGILQREKRFHSALAPKSIGGAYAVGLAFGFGWTPCIGPILGAVLMMASVQETVGQGVALLIAYSLGLGVPFMLAALSAGYLTAFRARFRRFYQVVEIGSGVLLIAIGILIFSGKLAWLSAQFGFLRRFAL
jgi:cytochrome c-type biogenesis protein